MTCRQCGTNWAKDVDFDELNGEMSRRRMLAIRAEQSFMELAWPTYGRAHWLASVNLLIAVFGATLLTVFLPVDVSLPVLIGVFFLTWLLAFSPGVYLLGKESRLLKRFKELHPEQVKALEML
jgi:hypothetical protein